MLVPFWQFFVKQLLLKLKYKTLIIKKLIKIFQILIFTCIALSVMADRIHNILMN